MGYQDFITESEAAALAGVSGNTLMRFAEAGYIRIESDSDGLTLYCKSQISDVFGLKAKRVKPKHLSHAGARRNPQARQFQAEVPKREPSSERKVERAAPLYDEDRNPTDDAAQNGSKTRLESLNSRVEKVISLHDKHSQVNLGEEATVLNIAEQSMTSQQEASTSDVEAAPAKEPTGTSATRESDIQSLTHALEIERLKHLASMLEKLLDAKSLELDSVKQERDWLRSRIERMEEKADRDQLLLMSETQMLRRLLEERAAKRSVLRAALEWVGLANPHKDLSKRVSIEARDISQS